MNIASIGTEAPLSGKGKGPNELFEAAVTASKALAYELKIMSEFYYEVLSSLRHKRTSFIVTTPTPLDISIVLPIIVFDGAMFLWNDSKKDIVPINSIIYSFFYRSPHYFDRYTIVIVRKEEFIPLLEKLNNDLQSLCQRFREVKNKLNANIKLISVSYTHLTLTTN